MEMSLNVTFAMGALIRNYAGWNKDAYIDNIKKNSIQGELLLQSERRLAA